MTSRRHDGPSLLEHRLVAPAARTSAADTTGTYADERRAIIFA